MKVPASLSPLRTLGMDVYIGIGSNLGDRRRQLADAVAAFPDAGLEVIEVSPLVESPAMLPEGAPPEWNLPFLNAAVRCRARSSPFETLDGLKAIERRFGRDFSARWSPRPIDLDILLWGNEQIRDDRLTVPHPGLATRNFVLAPLVALNPSLRISGLGRTVLELSRGLRHVIPLWMGILNITPDSFSDGGETTTWAAVERRVDAMIDAGVHILDLGAESTRPGAAPLTPDEEWRRLEPILARLGENLRTLPLPPRISIDTYHADVARRALNAGVDIINDVGGLASPGMLAVAAESEAMFVAMHSLTVPADRDIVLPADRDPVDELLRWLDVRRREWAAAGIAERRILFDPGIGFGKSSLQSLELLRDLRRLHAPGMRILVGHSRKSFMAGLAKRDAADKNLFTVGASLQLCAQGVDVLRVHDVPAHASAYRGWAHLLPMG